MPKQFFGIAAAFFGCGVGSILFARRELRQLRWFGLLKYRGRRRRGSGHVAHERPLRSFPAVLCGCRQDWRSDALRQDDLRLIALLAALIESDI